MFPRTRPARPRSRFSTARRGAALVEYAILIGLIGVVALASVGDLGRRVANLFGEVSTEIALGETGPLEIFSSDLPRGDIDQPYGYDFRQNLAGSAEDVTWSLTGGALPDGLALGSDGIITGAPTTSETQTFEVTAERAGQTASQSFSIKVGPARFKAVQVAMGGGHGCGITPEGALYCWGANGHGAVGQGHDDYHYTRPVPVIGMDSGVTDVTAGWNHSCAIKDTAVWCWGNDSDGQVGDGDAATTEGQPVQVIASGATDVEAASHSTCAIVGPQVYCWGRDYNGTLGNGGSDVDMTSPTPIASGPVGIKRLAGGTFGFCALDEDSAAWCWGSGGSGANGDDDRYANRSPGRVSPLPGETAMVGNGLVRGAAHSCMLTDQGPSCWGYNSDGQLGDGTTSHQDAPVLAVNFGNPTQMAASYSTTCFIGTSGGAQCVGDDGRQELGNGSSDSYRSLVASDVVGIRGTPVGIVAGRNNFCTLMQDQSVMCWGDGSNYALANGAGSYLFYSAGYVLAPVN